MVTERLQEYILVIEVGTCGADDHTAVRILLRVGEDDLSLGNHTTGWSRCLTEDLCVSELTVVVCLTLLTLVGIELLVIQHTDNLAVLHDTDLGLRVEQRLIDIEYRKCA